MDRFLNIPLPQLATSLGYARQYAIHAGAIALFALIGVSLGLLKSGSLDNAPPSKDTWSLPQLPSRAAPPELGTDEVADLFWSDEPRAKRVVAQAKAPVSVWRFTGTFAQGDRLYAIIIDDKRAKNLKPGDALPDGAIIKDVQEGTLSFEQNGAIKTRRLYDKGTPQ